MVARGIALISPLLVLPMMVDHLGAELFGLWATGASLIALASFADLGTANAAMSRLSVASANRDWSTFKVVSLHAYLLAFAFSGLLATLLVLCIIFVDPSAYVGQLRSLPDRTVQTVMLVFVMGFLGTVPFTLIQRVQYATGAALQANGWLALGALGQLAAVWLCTQLGAEGITTIFVAVLVPPLALVLNTVLYFALQRRDIAPVGRVSLHEIRRTFGLSMAFFFLSVLTSLAMNLDQFLIARIAGLEAAGDYAISFRMFSVLSLLVTMAALAMWPSNSDALSSGDFQWVKRNARQMSLFLGGAVGIAGAVLFALRDHMASFWLGQPFSIAPLLGASLVLWSLLRAASSPYFSTQNAQNYLVPQYIGWGLYLVASVGAKMLLVASIGIAGAPLGSCLAYIIILVPTAYLGHHKALRRAASNIGGGTQ